MNKDKDTDGCASLWFDEGAEVPDKVWANIADKISDKDAWVTTKKREGEREMAKNTDPREMKTEDIQKVVQKISSQEHALKRYEGFLKVLSQTYQVVFSARDGFTIDSFYWDEPTDEELEIIKKMLEGRIEHKKKEIEIAKKSFKEKVKEMTL